MPPNPIRPEDLFRAEKERATSASRSLHARLLAEAKVAFEKLMAEGQAARKSGRPRKHPLPPLKTGSALRPPQAPLFERFGPVAVAVEVPVTNSAPVAAKAAKGARPKAKTKAKGKAKAKPKAKSKGKAKPKAKAKGKRSKR
jgi:hypothetical protein